MFVFSFRLTYDITLGAVFTLLGGRPAYRQVRNDQTKTEGHQQSRPSASTARHPAPRRGLSRRQARSQRATRLRRPLQPIRLEVHPQHVLVLRFLLSGCYIVRTPTDPANHPWKIRRCPTSWWAGGRRAKKRVLRPQSQMASLRPESENPQDFPNQRP